MITAEELIKIDIDPVPKYRLMRDVLKLKSDNIELVNAKRDVLQTKWVKEIISLQWDDGSWGQFHSMSRFSKSVITTEQALRRLLILGLDKDDEQIKRAYNYMEKYLLREVDLRDYKEKKHDWDLLTRLFVATWMIIIDPSNTLAMEIAKDWSKIITYAFSKEEYNQEYYKEAYYEIHKSPKKKYMWGFQNFYVVALLSRVLSSDIESKFLDYIINSEKGIYYIYDNNLKSLADNYCSKQASRYISAFELLSSYSLISSKCKHLVEWINKNLSGDGFWDMEQSVKDNMYFPLSNSWRKTINRKIDCTVRMQILLSNIYD
ncbi:hypothetical protein [Alkaliphilus peptidifermentans]|uniref:Uncharacterized protein n=1 Tax=Alkaliphilus peptidifermentans DSM 18978 TaxID=1120976 RepID=A0A1G5GWN7_9FIRM|nr:hypothetical protein [Alkaliphilus peptidifermentans]SCY55787.1 hypothetical protein SAMN03080606_01803 [Alkaliphilus peptidifermentans DSM 18978]